MHIKEVALLNEAFLSNENAIKIVTGFYRVMFGVYECFGVGNYGERAGFPSFRQL